MADNRQRAKLWLPPSARESAEKVGSRCRICGKTFKTDEETARVRHVQKCLEDNRETVEARRFNNPFESITDHEYEDWVRREGRIR